MRNPSRDVVIKLAFGFGLDFNETQELLKCARYSVLDGRDKRDAIIAHALENGYSLIETNDRLDKQSFLALGAKPNVRKSSAKRNT